MPWNDTLNHLQSVLADLYPLREDILRVVRQAGLPPERIELSGKAINTWHEVLVQAQLQERVEALIAVARAEYPNNRALARACQAYVPFEKPPAEPVVIPDGTPGLRRVFVSYATEADGESPTAWPTTCDGVV